MDDEVKNISWCEGEGVAKESYRNKSYHLVRRGKGDSLFLCFGKFRFRMAYFKHDTSSRIELMRQGGGWL
jgi:hypothetical protein